MSRMTKFLKQTATLQKVERDAKGVPKLDIYGEPVYSKSKETVKCRRERSTKDVLTTGGSAVVSTTVYYIDNETTLNTGDLIDGKPILTVSDYVNLQGIVEGYEVTI